MSNSDIICEQHMNIAIITINRPEKRNAMTEKMMQDLKQMLLEVDSNQEIRVIILKGAGNKAFSAGFDLSPDRDNVPEDGIAWQKHLSGNNDVIQLIWDISKPVIAQVQGFCLAGALDLMTACDLAICSEDAIFGAPEILFGGTSQYLLLPYLVDMRICKYLLLTGKNIDAQTALKANLVNAVVKASEIDDYVIALSKQMALLPEGTLELNKRSLNRVYDLMGAREATRLSLDAAHYSIVCKSEEAIEFSDIVSDKGLKAAFAWRDRKFNT